MWNWGLREPHSGFRLWWTIMVFGLTKIKNFEIRSGPFFPIFSISYSSIIGFWFYIISLIAEAKPLPKFLNLLKIFITWPWTKSGTRIRDSVYAHLFQYHIVEFQSERSGKWPEKSTRFIMTAHFRIARLGPRNISTEFPVPKIN